MFKKIAFLLFFIIGINSNAQIVINELNADNPSSDEREFVELKSVTPNFSLNGYVIVFFSGTGTGLVKTSYKTIDLDGYTTDINGIIHFGNAGVSPTPSGTFASNTIFNNPCAVGLYFGSDTDFPFGTTAVANNLIDSLCYTNSTSVQPTALMSAFGNSVCTYVPSESSTATDKSIQRKIDGTYEIKIPTPGMNNDGSGIVLTYLTMSTGITTITEGQSFTISITSSQAVSGSNLVINFLLDNGNFNANDFTGSTSITIPIGATTGSTTIQVLNDGINEGDEELNTFITSVPTGYSLYNNNIIVRVNDINYVTLPFGAPSNPTFGTVATTAPAGYYASLDGLSGNLLKQELQNIIANPSIIHGHNYGDIYDILKVADQNPLNSNQVWMIYTETPRSKIDYQSGTSIVGKWNREHIYCQSRGGFADATSSTPAGINVWEAAGPDIIATGHADAHHIRAVDGQENSSRNNRNYGSDYNGPSGNTANSWKGDVARACFYMAVRYNGLNVVNGDPSDAILGQIGDLSTLLSWNHLDPSDDFEMNRNNYIYTWQVNRNPFIDYPDLADFIWGSRVGETWHALSNKSFDEDKLVVYPNPALHYFKISGFNGKATVELYSVLGAKIFEKTATDELLVDSTNLSSGVYIAKIVLDKKIIEKKIVIK